MDYKRANTKTSFMGLDNKVCRSPDYWCRLHQVWLSEQDVARKKCKEKLTFDMLGTHRCGNLEKRKAVKIHGFIH